MAALNLGLALLELGRPDEAATALETAVSVSPTDYEARFHLGVALERAGQGGRARAEFLKVAAARGDSQVSPALRQAAAARAQELAGTKP